MTRLFDEVLAVIGREHCKQQRTDERRRHVHRILCRVVEKHLPEMHDVLRGTTYSISVPNDAPWSRFKIKIGYRRYVCEGYSFEVGIQFDLESVNVFNHGHGVKDFPISPRSPDFVYVAQIKKALQRCMYDVLQMQEVIHRG